MANWIYIYVNIITNCHWAAICLTECCFFNKYWQNVLVCWFDAEAWLPAMLHWMGFGPMLLRMKMFCSFERKKKIFDQVSVTPMINCWFNCVAWHSFIETNPMASSPGGLDDWWCIGWHTLTQGWVWGICIYSTWRSCDALWWKRMVFHWNTGPCNSLWSSELLRQRSVTV